MKIDGIPNPATMEDEIRRMQNGVDPAPAVNANEPDEDDDDLFDLLCFEKDKWTPCSKP